MDDEKIDSTKLPPDSPLTVWLRGDEPYFEDFSLQAEQVMETLGIKRSRLRQISGSELRVGRKRVDRYVRPVYRPQDVDQYKAWTRSTASHQKSSAVLEDAAKNLAHNSQNLMTQVAVDCKQLLLAVEEKVDLFAQPLLRQQADTNQDLKRALIQVIRKTQEQSQQNLEQCLLPLLAKVAYQQTSINQELNDLHKDLAAIADFKQLILEGYNLQKSTHISIQKTDDLFLGLQEKMQDHMNEILQSVQAILAANKENKEEKSFPKTPLYAKTLRSHPRTFYIRKSLTALSARLPMQQREALPDKNTRSSLQRKPRFKRPSQK